MSVIKLKGTEAALIANNSHATNIGSATAVRVYNNHTAKGIVTCQTVSDSATVATGAVVKGTISVGPAESVIIRKDPTDEVWGSAATLLAAAVSVEG